MRTLTSLALVLAASLGSATAADNPRKAFVESWQGRRVVVKRTLYTLVYNEHGRLGKTFRDKREGLTVATPAAGTYFQFDGPDPEEAVSGRDPQQVMDGVSGRYRTAYTLDIGSFQRIEPLMLARYEPGVELVVKSVRIERDRVRLLLAQDAAETDAAAGQLATTLTVRWPVDLSRNLVERPGIESVIGQFVAVAER